MSEFPPTVSAFDPAWTPGRLGGPGETGVFVAERRGLAIASVIAGQVRSPFLAAATVTLGFTPPDSPTVMSRDGVAAIGVGSGKWLVLAEADRASGFVEGLRQSLGSMASVVDQSDGRGVLRLHGSAARKALAKGLPIDLHPSVFRPGNAATSMAAGIGLTLWQVDETPTYDIAVARSYGKSFLHWLSEAAAEFGCEWAAVA